MLQQKLTSCVLQDHLPHKVTAQWHCSSFLKKTKKMILKGWTVGGLTVYYHIYLPHFCYCGIGHLALKNTVDDIEWSDRRGLFLLTKCTIDTIHPSIVIHQFFSSRRRGKTLATTMSTPSARVTTTLWMCVRSGQGSPREMKSYRSRCLVFSPWLMKVTKKTLNYSEVGLISKGRSKAQRNVQARSLFL